MRIAVIGAGQVGSTLGRRWAEAGHEVSFALRRPEQHAARLSAEAPGARVRPIGDAIASAEVVLLAVPGAAVEDVVRDHAQALERKLVVDASNRLDGGPANGLAALAAHAPTARGVRAFNSVGWEILADPDFGGIAADLFYCGPEAGDAAPVERLIADLGLRPVRVGGPNALAVVDSLAPLWFALGPRGGRGRHVALKLLSR